MRLSGQTLSVPRIRELGSTEYTVKGPSSSYGLLPASREAGLRSGIWLPTNDILALPQTSCIILRAPSFLEHHQFQMATPQNEGAAQPALGCVMSKKYILIILLSEFTSKFSGEIV